MDESRTLSWLSRCSEERSQVEACGIPELKCACGWPAAPRTSSTIRNPARRWLQCGGEVYDAIYGYGRSPQEYVEDMMAYYHAGEYNSLRETQPVAVAIGRCAGSQHRVV
ncbi:Os07g0485267 [Oryza sativa Japonica Group]|uniref:Os07g0485267 protein n=1 Tax=Oryza sativa subsp. japonica TaxID=39947 RepID=A0A0P0X6E7_ORYSJ|nr:Os07g0485267 [Oryza sativa Japonica Group]